MMHSVMVRRIAIVAALSLHVSAALAQGTAPAASRIAAMHRFDGWVGLWAGSGWSIDATGKRSEFTREERVQRKLDGAVLYVEGRGVTKGSEAPMEGIVLVSWDEKGGHYRWHGHDSAMGSMDAEPRFVDGGFQWAITVGPSSTIVRFAITLDATHWNEVGEVSADGKSWSRFMEMHLIRQ